MVNWTSVHWRMFPVLQCILWPQYNRSDVETKAWYGWKLEREPCGLRPNVLLRLQLIHLGLLSEWSPWFIKSSFADALHPLLARWGSLLLAQQVGPYWWWWPGWVVWDADHDRSNYFNRNAKRSSVKLPGTSSGWRSVERYVLDLQRTVLILDLLESIIRGY